MAFYRGLKNTFNFKDETYKGDEIQFNGLAPYDHETFVLKRSFHLLTKHKRI